MRLLRLLRLLRGPAQPSPALPPVPQLPLKRCAARWRPPCSDADEANVLMEWYGDEEGEPQLKELMRFFVSVATQDCSAHVVLATSNFFMLEWLRARRWCCRCACA